MHVLIVFLCACSAQVQMTAKNVMKSILLTVVDQVARLVVSSVCLVLTSPIALNVSQVLLLLMDRVNNVEIIALSVT